MCNGSDVLNKEKGPDDKSVTSVSLLLRWWTEEGQCQHTRLHGIPELRANTCKVEMKEINGEA